MFQTTNQLYYLGSYIIPWYYRYTIHYLEVSNPWTPKFLVGSIINHPAVGVPMASPYSIPFFL